MPIRRGSEWAVVTGGTRAEDRLSTFGIYSGMLAGRESMFEAIAVGGQKWTAVWTMRY